MNATLVKGGWSEETDPINPVRVIIGGGLLGLIIEAAR
jgi:hypothetical protein